MAEKMYCGVDVGGTKILAALVDGCGQVRARRKCATPQKVKAPRVYNEIRNNLKTLFADHDIDADALTGIGMGIPGIVHPNQTDILRTPNIDLAGFPLAQRLSKYFGVKVVLGNDVNLGLMGEHWLGAGQGCRNIIGLFPGTGVGGAIIINGQLLCGEQGVAGELGHVIIQQDSPQSSAGLNGTIEALASRRAMERDIRAAVEQGQDSVVLKKLSKKTDVIKSKAIAHALAVKDPVVIKVMNAACTTLGNACNSMRHIFNPELIILGGGLVEACGDFMLPRIRRRTNANPFLSGIDKCRIVVSRLGDDAVLLGAVAFLKGTLRTDPVVKAMAYPKVSLQHDQIRLDDILMYKDFFIRSDGKVKEISGRPEFASYYRKSVLDGASLSMICRKKTRHLLVGKKDRSIRITGEGREFLKQNGTEMEILPLAKALSVYAKGGKRRALFVSHAPSV